MKVDVQLDQAVLLQLANARDRHEAKRNGGALIGFRGFPREPFLVREKEKIGRMVIEW